MYKWIRQCELPDKFCDLFVLRILALSKFEEKKRY